MPGHTHVQPAQPVLFAHHLLAYVEMLERDRGRFADARRRANVSPLGSGALAGTGYAIDREAVAADLGFDGVTRNSIDAVGDRDFVVEALLAASLTMVHASRLAEELVWWSEPQLRVPPTVGRVLHRLLDDAQQAQPGPRGAHPRPDGEGHRPAHRGAGAAQGPPRQLSAGPPGGQAAAVRRARDARVVRAGADRHDRDAQGGPGPDGGRRRDGPHHRHSRCRRDRGAGCAVPVRTPRVGAAGGCRRGRRRGPGPGLR